MRAVRSSASVQTAFCQEGFQGEDEPEQAFQVSPQAIAAECQVELATDRMSAGPPASQ